MRTLRRRSRQQPTGTEGRADLPGATAPESRAWSLRASGTATKVAALTLLAVVAGGLLTRSFPTDSDSGLGSRLRRGLSAASGRSGPDSHLPTRPPCSAGWPENSA